MAKLLKPLVVVLLLLSAVSLGLGIVLFNQREVIKGRTQNLERATESFARALHYPDLDTQAIMDYDRMDRALNSLYGFAVAHYQELQDTKQDLANTKADLEQTREELQITQNQLRAAQQQIVTLNERLPELEAQVARANQNSAQLERDKVGLQERIDDLELQVAQVELEKLELQDELADANDEVVRLNEELGVLTGDEPTTPRGLSGEIIIVNSEWNFVVLNLGRQQKLGLNTEMLVHRDDQLVGRIRVSSVEPNLAIAEILSDWQQLPLQEGDHVLF